MKHSRAVQLPSQFHGLFSDLRPVFQDIAVTAIIFICWDNIVDGLVIPIIVVIFHSFPDSLDKLCGTVVVVQQDEIFH